MGDAICAGISGTWVAAAMKEKLGDNYAAAKLPTFTVDGEQVRWVPSSAARSSA